MLIAEASEFHHINILIIDLTRLKKCHSAVGTNFENIFVSFDTALFCPISVTNVRFTK